MTEQDKLKMSRVIDVLKNELDQHPEILISTKSGRELAESERVEFFRRLENQGQAQPGLIEPFLNHTGSLMSSLHQKQPIPAVGGARFLVDGGSTSMSPHYVQQTPPDEVMEQLTQFGKWVEDTFSDPGILTDTARAIGAIGNAYSAGAPINTVGSSILPVIIQIGAKILGFG